MSLGERFSNDDFSVSSAKLSNDSLSLTKKPQLPMPVDKNILKWPRYVNDIRIVSNLYGSNYSIGSKIRDATTGIYSEYNVGTKYEFLFFKAVFATGYNNRKEPYVLYFNSPEEYMQYFNVTISTKDKTDWSNRRQKLLDESC